MIFFMGNVVWVCFLIDEYNGQNQTKKELFCSFTAGYIFGCMSYIPFVIAFEMFISGFSLFPLCTWEYNKKLGPHGEFSTNLTSFITSGNHDEKQEKMFYLNKVVVNKIKNFRKK
eukprot:UN34267